MKKIIILGFSLLSFNLLASSGGITGLGGTGGSAHGYMSVWDGPMYYNKCVEQVHIKEFGPMAMNAGTYGIEVEKETFQDYQEQLLEVIQKTNNEKVNNIQEIFTQLTKFLIKQKVAKSEQDLEIKVKEQELKLEYEARLRADVEKANSSPFGDTAPDESPTAGTFTYEYMKNMCKRTKMLEKTQGDKARINTTRAISKKSDKNIDKRQSVVSIEAESIKNINKHYDLFCSPSDVDNGLCEMVSALPNADLDANMFLSPEGFKELNTTDYKTKYTYNELEALGADSFINNVIGVMPISPPTPSELSDKDKAKFVSLYNQLFSSLNIASFSFEQSYQKRLPKNKEGVRLSLLDTLNYLVEDMNSPQNKSLDSNAKANAFEMAYQSVMALKTKIDLEILLQKERLKLLDATLLSLEENKAEKIRKLESSK